MGEQFERQKSLLRYYRKQGYFVVAGGSFASLCPDEYEPFADAVICGEAEYIWPAFCQDFESGKPDKLYRETGEVDMEQSPIPRFDLLQLDKYWSSSLQFSRGCPHRCEFCDIIVMFGRKPRTKSPKQICAELDALRALGVRHVFFVDDNFSGHKKAVKELLRALIDYQIQHHFPFRFGAEATVDAAQDPELLKLMKQANFAWIFIGIETINRKSLEQTKKFQNLRQDALTSVRAIYAHGMDVYGGFIVGFDHDDLSVFEQQYRFIIQSGIQVSIISLLNAIPRTPLYDRLKQEQRLIPDGHSHIGAKPGTNIAPENMSYDEMIDHYKNLYFSLFQDSDIAERIKNKTRYFRNASLKSTGSLSYKLCLMGRVLRFGIWPGGPRRWWHFLTSIPWTSPGCLYLAINDWAMGLGIRSYCERHFSDRADYSDDSCRVIKNIMAQQLKSKHAILANTHLSNGFMAPSLTLYQPALTFSKDELAEMFSWFFTHTASALILDLTHLPEHAITELAELLGDFMNYRERILLLPKDRGASRFNELLWRYSLMIEPTPTTGAGDAAD
jgi:radical SAM superfamily enzyme YgiQ (UPF0313 family)